MPIYTYRCPAGHEWDEIRPIKGDSSAASEPCPACGAAGSKIPAPFSATFHGTGWTPKFHSRR